MAVRITCDECSVSDFTMLRDGLTARGDTLIVKFSAEWCKPCRTIAPLCQRAYSKFPDSVYILEIDVDTSLDVYSRFKRARMLKGIPALFVWYTPLAEGAMPFPPDDSCVSAVPGEVGEFFERIRERVDSDRSSRAASP